MQILPKNFNDSPLVSLSEVNKILTCNDYTVNYSLVLSHEQVRELIKTRQEALKANGRVEFRSVIIEKLVYEFCDSPFLFQDNFAQTLHELIDIFYYYKNETRGVLSDNELIQFMGKAFNGFCQGSLELLSGTALEEMVFDLFGKNDINGKNRYNRGFEEEEDYDE